MAVNLYRKKNIFEKLSPLWALIMTAVHIGSIWYVFYITDNFSLWYDYTAHIKYFIWIAVVVVSTWSFVPESITAIVRHVSFYLLSSAVCIAALYGYAFNHSEGQHEAIRAYIAFLGGGGFDDDYARYVVKYAIEYSVYLCGAVAAFCVVKYHMSATGWIKKHIK